MKKQIVLSLACVAGAFSGGAFSAQGEYWEITTKMEMPGMPFAMPAQTMKVCIAKGAEQDPRSSSDKNCEVTDVKTSGNKTSWKVRCNQNGEVMTGSGEASGNADKSEGTIHLNGMSGGTKVDMTQSYVNKRLGGSCDAEEQSKKIMGQVCDTSGYDTQQWIYSTERFVKDTHNTCPGKKEAACNVVRKEAPRDVNAYSALVQIDKNNGGSIAKGCGISMEATTKAICKTLSSSNADVLASYCPAEAKAYRENERRKACEGRSYTAKEDLSKCLVGKEGENRSNDVQAKGNPVAPPAGDSSANTAPPESANPAAALMDGAKKLKGLFGL